MSFICQQSSYFFSYVSYLLNFDTANVIPFDSKFLLLIYPLHSLFLSTGKCVLRLLLFSSSSSSIFIFLSHTKLLFIIYFIYSFFLCSIQFVIILVQSRTADIDRNTCIFNFLPQVSSRSKKFWFVKKRKRKGKDFLEFSQSIRKRSLLYFISFSYQLCAGKTWELLMSLIVGRG